MTSRYLQITGISHPVNHTGDTLADGVYQVAPEIIRISDKENDSDYHIWDNRVLPGFMTEHGERAVSEALFRHPDTQRANEQILNSVIATSAQGESGSP